MAYQNNIKDWKKPYELGVNTAENLGVPSVISLPLSRYPNPSSGVFTIKGLYTQQPLMVLDMAAKHPK